MADRFVIGPTGGLENDLKPFMIADEAMASLKNAYPFRGRLRKRFGSDYMGDSQLTSRLRVLLGMTDASGNLIFTSLPDNFLNVGAAFSVGSVIYTVTQVPTVVGAGGEVLTLSTNAGTVGTLMLFSAAPNVYQFQVSGGLIAIANTNVYWYPSLPVMGLTELDFSTFVLQVPVAFDTQFAYQFSGGWERMNGEADVGAATWTGSNSDFFWATMWTGASAADRLLYVTNYNHLEPNFMRFFSSVDNLWHNFVPQVDNANLYLTSARILVVFKNRLLAFNTWEGDKANPRSSDINYSNRVRWSQANADPSAANAWNQSIPGKGNGLDAPTTQAIITVEFVKDRLIVYFEESTFELVYSGNQVYPFLWQKINTELGAESTFSIVPFDKIALGIGNVGIHACNGSNVDRIDNLIPDEVFAIHTVNEGIARVAGIREYKTEMVYWTLPDPSASTDQPYPNKLLLYNYKTGGWAFVDDSFTAFGYFYQQSGITWDSTTVTWADDVSWNDGALEAQFRQVIAGNQEGYVTILDPDEPTNAGALQATNITDDGAGFVLVNCIDHNLRDGDFISFPWVIDVTGTLRTIINGLTSPSGNTTMPPIWYVSNVIDGNNFNIIFTGTPVGNPILDSIALGNVYSGGTPMARVSQIDIVTKAFNFYAKKGMNASINNIDFLVDNSVTGEITLDWFTSTNLNSQRAAAQATGTLLGTNVLSTRPYALYPFENEQQQLWHRSYVQANGMYIQLELSFQNEQMIDPFKSGVDFQLHQIVFNAQPTASRLQ